MVRLSDADHRAAIAVLVEKIVNPEQIVGGGIIVDAEVYSHPPDVLVNAAVASRSGTYAANFGGDAFWFFTRVSPNSRSLTRCSRTVGERAWWKNTVGTFEIDDRNGEVIGQLVKFEYRVRRQPGDKLGFKTEWLMWEYRALVRGGDALPQSAGANNITERLSDLAICKIYKTPRDKKNRLRQLDANDGQVGTLTAGQEAAGRSNPEPASTVPSNLLYTDSDPRQVRDDDLLYRQEDCSEGFGFDTSDMIYQPAAVGFPPDVSVYDGQITTSTQRGFSHLPADTSPGTLLLPVGMETTEAATGNHSTAVLSWSFVGGHPATDDGFVGFGPGSKNIEQTADTVLCPAEASTITKWGTAAPFGNELVCPAVRDLHPSFPDTWTHQQQEADFSSSGLGTSNSGQPTAMSGAPSGMVGELSSYDEPVPNSTEWCFSNPADISSGILLQPADMVNVKAVGQTLATELRAFLNKAAQKIGRDAVFALLAEECLRLLPDNGISSSSHLPDISTTTSQVPSHLATDSVADLLVEDSGDIMAPTSSLNNSPGDHGRVGTDQGNTPQKDRPDDTHKDAVADLEVQLMGISNDPAKSTREEWMDFLLTDVILYAPDTYSFYCFFSFLFLLFTCFIAASFVIGNCKYTDLHEQREGILVVC